MKNLEEFRKDCQNRYKEMMAILESENVNNELFKVYYKSREKGEIFKELAMKYDKMRKAIEELLKRRSELLDEVDKCMAEFAKEKAGQDEDPSRIMFLNQIDDECKEFNKCYDALNQGSHFYTQLKEKVNELMGIIKDFGKSMCIERDQVLANAKKSKHI